MRRILERPQRKAGTGEAPVGAWPYDGLMITPSDIRERLVNDPFEPFRIRSTSGEAHEIMAPFLVALMRSKVFIAEPNSDKWNEVPYLHIAALESLTNGHGSRRPRRGRRR